MKTTGPSLNDCLYTGPNFVQTILDILLSFHMYWIALVGDIEKAFLMLSVELEDQDCLRFLWVWEVADNTPEIVAPKFTCVIFGMRSSAFLLTATINHHIEMYRLVDPELVDKFLASIYVDVMSFGVDSLDST